TSTGRPFPSSMSRANSSAGAISSPRCSSRESFRRSSEPRAPPDDRLDLRNAGTARVRSARLPAVLALSLTMVFWGSGGALVRSLALAIEPQNALAIRYALLTAINLVGLLLFGSPIARSDWPRVLIAGVVGIAGFNV